MDTFLGAENAQNGMTPEISTLIQDIINIFELKEPQKIRLIRKEYRSLCLSSTLEDSHGKNLIKKLSSYYRIPEFILQEIFAHLQHIGAISGVGIQVDSDAKKGFEYYNNTTNFNKEAKKYIMSKQVQFTIQHEDYNIVHKFLTGLSQSNIIRQIIKKGASKKDIPRGFFRTISLNDISYPSFSTLEEYCSFLLTNIEQQDQLFGEEYLDLMIQNGGIPVNDIQEIKYLRQANNIGVVNIGRIEIEGKEIPLELRMVPGYSPVGIDFVLSLNLDGNNNNQCGVIGIQFENQDGIHIPVIHTIQQAIHNVGFKNNQVVPIVEADEPDMTLPIKIKKKIDKEITNIFIDREMIKNNIISYIDSHGIGTKLIRNLSQNTQKKYKNKRNIGNIEPLINDLISNSYDTGLILANTCAAYFLSKGYPEIQIINPSQNGRLTNHNQNRSKESLKTSMENSYTKKGNIIGAQIDQSNGRQIITASDYVQCECSSDFLSTKFIHTNRLLKKINSMFGNNHGSSVPEFNSKTTLDQSLFELFARKKQRNNLST